MLKNIFKMMLLTLFCLIYAEAQTDSRDLVAGKVFLIDSKALNEKRPVYISLPTQYDQSKEKFPILVVLDGEGNFAFSNGLMNFLGQTGRVPRMIVLGIPNTNRDRDLTPTIVPDRDGGGAENFIRFIKDELLPYIENNYRTVPYRILFGHSLGGMFCVYSLTEHPDLFNAYVAASPYLEYDNRLVLEGIEKKLQSLSGKSRKLYISLGNEPAYTESIDELTDKLNDAPETVFWKYEQMEAENHNTVRLRSLYNGLEFIFSDWQIEANVIAGGCDAIKKKYEQLAIIYNYKITPDENTLNAIGYGYINDRRFDEAIKTLCWNVELYPESSNVYDSLGEAFENNNEPKLAYENYKKALEIGRKTNAANNEIYETNVNRMKKLLAE